MKYSKLFGNKKFGFGMMRLPMLEVEGKQQVDIEQVCKMVDLFMKAGFCYFDTAHGYLDGLSELAIRDCLAKRYPRDSYLLTNKLTSVYFKKQEEIVPLFHKQLEACGVEYFDIYLMHSIAKENYGDFQKCNAFETALKLNEQGLIRHLGLSFHDSPEMLDKILTEHPETEVVQIQLNYLDAEDEQIQGLKNYEVCVKHGKPAIVMEPVKGGRLINMPTKAAKLVDEKGLNRAALALRYAASFDDVGMVISGMSNIAQMQDNIDIMKNFKPLNNEENILIDKLTSIMRQERIIECTKCGYCLSECPKHIEIPSVFTYMNELLYDETIAKPEYNNETGTPKDCISCHHCEKVCPQHLPIPKLMKKAVNNRIFE